MSDVTNTDPQISEKSLQLLFNNMLNGYAHCRVIYDQNNSAVDFMYIAVNSAFEKLTGLKDVVGKLVSAVIPGFNKTNPEVLALYARVAITGKSEELELYVSQLSIWLRLSVYCPEKDHFVAIFENITEKKTSEESLQRNEGRLSLALKTSKMGVWDWDINTNAVYLSPELLAISGKQNFEGTLDAFANIIQLDDKQGVMSAINAAVTDRKDFDIEFRIIHENGTVIWLSSLGKVYFDENNKPLRMIGTTMDITEKKKTIDSLQNRTEELEKFSKLMVDRELKMVELKKELNLKENQK